MRRAARNFAISSRKSLCAAKKKDMRSPSDSAESPARASRLDVRDAVRQRECDLLHGGRAGLADVVSAHGNRVPLRQLPLAEREDVGHEPKRRLRRINERAARQILLEDVVLHRARQFRAVDAVTIGDRDVHGEQDDRRRVNRHRRRDAIERDAVEERRHVVERIDGDADAPHFAGGQRVVRVVAHLCGQIERDAQSGHALREEVSIPAIRLCGRAEAGVLAHRPQPAAIHRRLDAPGERELTRPAQVPFGIRTDRDRPEREKNQPYKAVLRF